MKFGPLKGVEMSKEDLISQSFNCTDCGAIYKLNHNEIQESRYCPFCKGSAMEDFDENDMAWEPDFDDSIGDNDEEEWD